ncbi:hypothetical protein QJS66_12410 [Kocuria rhizophila]|nr:hypothetical protein QJS66_12410 [Kocuria rhizophila]
MMPRTSPDAARSTWCQCDDRVRLPTTSLGRRGLRSSRPVSNHRPSARRTREHPQPMTSGAVPPVQPRELVLTLELRRAASARRERCAPGARCQHRGADPYDDHHLATFFMRVHMAPLEGSALSEDALRRDLTPVASSLGCAGMPAPGPAPRAGDGLQSRHCLNDLLFRARTGELPVETVAVVSNHLDSHAWWGPGAFVLPRARHQGRQAGGGGAAAGARGPLRGGPGGARPVHAGTRRLPGRPDRGPGSSTSTTRSCRPSRAGVPPAYERGVRP